MAATAPTQHRHGAAERNKATTGSGAAPTRHRAALTGTAAWRREQPEGSERLRRAPKGAEMLRKPPKGAERFRKPPKGAESL